MFSAPAAPAPTAMQMSAAMASTGCMWPGAATRPTSAVKTTRNITRGFISAKIFGDLAAVGGGQDFRACVETDFGHALTHSRTAKAASPLGLATAPVMHAVSPLFVI